jgi:hypothetical protein
MCRALPICEGFQSPLGSGVAIYGGLTHLVQYATDDMWALAHATLSASPVFPGPLRHETVPACL